MVVMAVVAVVAVVGALLVDQMVVMEVQAAQSISHFIHHHILPLPWPALEFLLNP
jgi:ABC-type Mn2+/Zn2+ transport system permease subunit